jgi:hypothetical protein
MEMLPRRYPTQTVPVPNVIAPSRMLVIMFAWLGDGEVPGGRRGKRPRLPSPKVGRRALSASRSASCRFARAWQG